jgi:hypothetical protein
MHVLATAIVDWTAMGKIFLVVLIAGTGIVVVFGFLLLGLKLAHRLGHDGSQSGTQDGAQKSESQTGGARTGGYVLAAASAVICVGVVVIGIYAMVNKPSSKPTTPTKAAHVIPAGRRVTLIASSR